MSSDFPSLSFNICHAKTGPDDSPGMRVVDHCRIVGYVARALLDILPDSVQTLLGQNPETAAALHDVGKISPGFQLKYFKPYLAQILPDLARIPASNFQTDHALISYAAVRDYLKHPSWAKIAGAHHGGLRGGRIPKDHTEPFGGKSWSQERKKLIDLLVSEFGAPGKQKESPVVQNLLAGLVSVADWIGSDETCFPAKGIPAGFDYMGEARKAVGACGWKIFDPQKGLSFEHIFKNRPYKVQQSFMDAVDGPGLYILEAPMGTGKTEAALYAAYALMTAGHNRGLFFGLPTRLTSEKIHERVMSFLDRICREGTRPKLAHSKAWLSEFSMGGKEFRMGKSWFDTRKRRILHPFAVGTIDQALLSVLNVKHFFVRTFGLAGKVVILDEVHSYDLYTGTLMEEMVSRLLEIGCTVIILSATLTRERIDPLLGRFPTPPRSQGVEPYPLFTKKTGDVIQEIPSIWTRKQSYDVETRDLDDPAVAREAVKAAEGGACVLLIATTVTKAQNWFDAVRGEMRENAFPLGMIHSKFPGFRREELETEWISRLGRNGDRPPRGCILVGTQVLEQSIDIDCDFLITEIAPMDMILQRMGRQWRHERENRPTDRPRTLIISSSPEGVDDMDEMVECFGKGNCYVYMPYLLLKTWTVWQGRPVVHLPRDIRPVLEATYCSPGETDPSIFHELYRIMMEMRANLRRRAESAKSSVRSLVMREDREELVTRYSDYETRDVLLVRHLDDTGNEAEVFLMDGGPPLHLSKFKKNFFHTARLHQNLVSVPLWLLNKMDAQRPPWLEKHFFENVPVWEWDDISGNLSMNDIFTGHTYDPHRGLRRMKLADENRYADMLVDDTDDFDPFDKNRMDW
jgi:CRISPR-associated endonuclease/helicase Cas3